MLAAVPVDYCQQQFFDTRALAQQALDSTVYTGVTRSNPQTGKNRWLGLKHYLVTLLLDDVLSYADTLIIRPVHWAFYNPVLFDERI